MIYSDGLWVPYNPDKVIRINPDNAERLKCSRCGKEFISRGIKDYLFGYILNGSPVYVPKLNVLCYECEEDDRRDLAEDTFIGGPLDEEE